MARPILKRSSEEHKVPLTASLSASPSAFSPAPSAPSARISFAEDKFMSPVSALGRTPKRRKDPLKRATRSSLFSETNGEVAYPAQKDSRVVHGMRTHFDQCFVDQLDGTLVPQRAPVPVEGHFQRRVFRAPVQQSLEKFRDFILKQLRITKQSPAAVFDVIDFDEDGLVTCDDLLAGLRRHLGVKAGVLLPKERVEWFFGEMAPDSQGRISKEHFLSFLEGEHIVFSGEPESPRQKKLHDIVENFHARVNGKHTTIFHAFLDIDTDRNGTVSPIEFEHGLKKVGLDYSSEEFDMLFQYFDSDASGELSYEEFCTGLLDYESHKRKVPPTPSQKGEVPLSKVLVPIDQQSRCMLKIQWKISKYLRGKMDAALKSFIRMDEDGDGRLSKGEFQAFCRRLGLGLTVTEMELLGDHLGIKEDGTVTFDDLKKFVESDEVMRFIGIQHMRKLDLTDGADDDIDDDDEHSDQDGNDDDEFLPIEERLTKPEHWGTRSIVQRIYEQLCVQERPFYDIFSRFDDDHDGYISYRDFLRGLRSINLTLSIADLHDFLSVADVKGAGVLHIETVARIFGDTNTGRDIDRQKDVLEERHRISEQRRSDRPAVLHFNEDEKRDLMVLKKLARLFSSNKDRVRACIRKHDQDHDRKLTYDEFRSVIRDLGYPITVSEAYRITVRLDPQKKGLLFIRKLLKFLGSPERMMMEDKKARLEDEDGHGTIATTPVRMMSSHASLPHLVSHMSLGDMSVGQPGESGRKRVMKEGQMSAEDLRLYDSLWPGFVPIETILCAKNVLADMRNIYAQIIIFLKQMRHELQRRGDAVLELQETCTADALRSVLYQLGVLVPDKDYERIWSILDTEKKKRIPLSVLGTRMSMALMYVIVRERHYDPDEADEFDDDGEDEDEHEDEHEDMDDVKSASSSSDELKEMSNPSHGFTDSLGSEGFKPSKMERRVQQSPVEQRGILRNVQESKLRFRAVSDSDSAPESPSPALMQRLQKSAAVSDRAKPSRLTRSPTPGAALKDSY